MHDQGEASSHRFLERFGRKFRKKLYSESSARKFVCKHCKRTQLINIDTYDVKHLEQLVSEQNLLIERLRADLKNEKAIVEKARNQCRNFSMVENDLVKVKALLSVNGIEEVSQKSFDYFKANIEQELRQTFNKTLHEVKLNHEKENKKLECLYKEELNGMRERRNLEDTQLLMNIKVLDVSLSNFKKSIQSLENNQYPSNQSEIEQLTLSLGLLNRSSQDLSPLLSNISQTLIESVEREITLRNELLNYKSQMVKSGENSKANVSKTTDIFSCMEERRFVQLEHSVDKCNHDKGKLDAIKTITLNEPSSLKIEQTGESGDRNESALKISDEVDTLLNYTNKLKKYIEDMVSFYTIRLHKFSNPEKESKCLELSSNTKDEIESPNTIRLMSDIKECHKMIFHLNGILKSLDFNLGEALKKNKDMEDNLTKMKQNHSEKVFSLDSHIKLLNDKIVICLRENKSLESSLADLRTKTVSNDQYTLLIREKERLLDITKGLEEEVRKLNEINDKLEKTIQGLQNEIPIKSNVQDVTLDLTEGSINYENMIPVSTVTSTPFHSKVSSKPEGHLSLDTLKSSLIDWVKRCDVLELEKKELERKLGNLNFSFNQANFSKNILEQEIDILRNNIKNIEKKLTDYVTLKEKCHTLENDNFVLNIKIKFMSELQNKDDKIDNRESDDKIINSDDTFYSDLNPDIFNSAVNAFNFVNEFQKKNQQIIILVSKCRSKDFHIRELVFKLNQTKEMEISLENKIEELIYNNNKMYEKVFSLIEENSQKDFEKRISDIELKSAKDQLNYLLSLQDTFKVSSSNNLIETMKNDALTFLKDSIDKWSKAEQMVAEISPTQIEKLDARHQVEILMKHNNLLKNDKEDLLLKLSNLQYQFDSLTKSSDLVAEEWYTQVDKYERELMEELKEQREQHARIEEALRSTGKLHDELQKQIDLNRVKIREISSLQKKLEDEKHKNECSEAQIILLEGEVKEKEKMLLETIVAKRACEDKLFSIEKGFAQKEKCYQTDLMTAKWKTSYAQNKSLESQVKKELTNFQNEVIIEQNENNKTSQASMEAIYQHSIDSLRYCMEQDKAQALSKTSEKHQTKVVRFKV